MVLRNQTILLFIYYVKNKSNIHFINFSYFKYIYIYIYICVYIYGTIQYGSYKVGKDIHS